MCAKVPIEGGDKLTASVLVEKQLQSAPSVAVKTDLIRSISSAVDRVAKRDIAVGEQLFYSDFGAQPELLGRPHPESEVY